MLTIRNRGRSRRPPQTFRTLPSTKMFSGRWRLKKSILRRIHRCGRPLRRNLVRNARERRCGRRGRMHLTTSWSPVEDLIRFTGVTELVIGVQLQVMVDPRSLGFLVSNSPHRVYAQLRIEVIPCKYSVISQVSTTSRHPLCSLSSLGASL